MKKKSHLMYARLWANLRPPFSYTVDRKSRNWALTECQNVSLSSRVCVCVCVCLENITYFHLQIYSMPQTEQITHHGQNWQCRQKKKKKTQKSLFFISTSPVVAFCFFSHFLFPLCAKVKSSWVPENFLKKKKYLNIFRLQFTLPHEQVLLLLLLFAFCAISNGHE